MSVIALVQARPIAAVYVHGAGAANAFPAGATKGQRRVDLIFDLNQGVQHHGATGVEIDAKTIDSRPGATVRIISIDVEFLDAVHFGRSRPDLARFHSRIRREA
jgi:hypothetical protein